jgi:hypothetical protein
MNSKTGSATAIPPKTDQEIVTLMDRVMYVHPCVSAADKRKLLRKSPELAKWAKNLTPEKIQRRWKEIRDED